MEKLPEIPAVGSIPQRTNWCLRIGNAADVIWKNEVLHFEPGARRHREFACLMCDQSMPVAGRMNAIRMSNIISMTYIRSYANIACLLLFVHNVLARKIADTRSTSSLNGLSIIMFHITTLVNQKLYLPPASYCDCRCLLPPLLYLWRAHSSGAWHPVRPEKSYFLKNHDISQLFVPILYVVVKRCIFRLKTFSLSTTVSTVSRRFNTSR